MRAALALLLGGTLGACIAPRSTPGGEDLALLVIGAGPLDARLILLTGDGDTPSGAEDATATYLVTLARPFRALMPSPDVEGPSATALVPETTVGSRPIPYLRVRDQALNELDGLPTTLRATHLPPLSDTRCAASEGCADEWTDPSGATLRICLVPCPPSAPPTAPEAPEPARPPTLARTRTGTHCGAARETTTLDPPLERCTAPEAPPLAACAPDARRVRGGGCAQLAACEDPTFGVGLDPSRTYFVAVGATEPGDGTRARPASALPKTLPPDVDTIVARGSLPLDALPETVRAIVAFCPDELTLRGSLTRREPLTIDGAVLRGHLQVVGAPLTLRRVVWDAAAPSAALVAEAGAAVGFDRVVFRGAAGAPARVQIDHAALRVTSSAIEGGPTWAITSSELTVDDVVAAGLTVTLTRGSTATLERVELHGAARAPVFLVEDSALSVRDAWLGALQPPSALFAAERATLDLTDVAADVQGAFLTVVAGRARLTDVAVTARAATAQPGHAIDVRGSTLTLTRVDLTHPSAPGAAPLTLVQLEGTRLEAEDVVLALGTDDDVGGGGSNNRTTWTRVTGFGPGRRSLELLGGTHALTDADLTLAPPATPPRDARPRGLQTPLLLAGPEATVDRARLDFTLTRARVTGGFFGIQSIALRGSATLEDVSIGPSTITRNDEGTADPAGLALEVEEVSAARVHILGRTSRGLVVVPARGATRTGPIRLTDVTVEDLGASPRVGSLCPSSARPAALLRTYGSTVTVERALFRDIDARGLLVEPAPGTVALRDLDFVDVRCRLLEARGVGTTRVERLRAVSPGFARDMGTRDDALGATSDLNDPDEVGLAGPLELDASDVDLTLPSARSVLRVNEFGRARVSRWRARGVLAVLALEDKLESPEGAAFLKDGEAVDAADVMIRLSGSCGALVAAPPFLRVALPRDRPVFPGCP